MLVTPKHTNDKHSNDSDELVKAYQIILNYATDNMQVSDSELDNFADTPVRAAKAFKEMIVPKKVIIQELNDILATGFPLEDSDEHTGIITQGPINVYSLCPHHLIFVKYEAMIAYKPIKGGTVLGLSKLARLAKLLGKRPVLQEQLTRDIADALHWHERENKQSVYKNKKGNIVKAEEATELALKLGDVIEIKYDNKNELPQIASEGSAVQLLGKHHCMSCRGVKEDAVTLTTELRGVFKNSHLKDEFYQAINSIRQAK